MVTHIPDEPLCCLSTDLKPMDVDNGKQIIEMDTGKTFMFDEENKRWLEQ